MTTENEDGLIACRKELGINKIPISENAVIQRINRKLAETDMRIRVNRFHSKAQRELGRYMVINSCNEVEQILWHTDDLNAIANNCNVLSTNEFIQGDL